METKPTSSQVKKETGSLHNVSASGRIVSLCEMKAAHPIYGCTQHNTTAEIQTQRRCVWSCWASLNIRFSHHLPSCPQLPVDTRGHSGSPAHSFLIQTHTDTHGCEAAAANLKTYTTIGRSAGRIEIYSRTRIPARSLTHRAPCAEASPPLSD